MMSKKRQPFRSKRKNEQKPFGSTFAQTTRETPNSTLLDTEGVRGTPCITVMIVTRHIHPKTFIK